MKSYAVWVDECSGNVPGPHEPGRGPYEAETYGAGTTEEGAVIEVYIDDVLLGTDDADDDLRLVEELLRTCEKCNTRLKLEKCEFMQEGIEYLVSKLDGDGGNL